MLPLRYRRTRMKGREIRERSGAAGCESPPTPSSRGVVLAAVLAFALSLTSCFTTVGSWTYPSGRYPTTVSSRPADVGVVVERFLDLRAETNRTWMTWAYVPLFPGGWTHCDRPEATAPGTYTPIYHMDPCEDLARSIAVELERERIVSRARYSSEGLRDPDLRYVLRGKVRSFYVHETRISYGVSVNAVLLWSLGLPSGSSDNGFLVDLELVDSLDKQVVWRCSVFDADHHVEGFYYGPEWYRFSWMWERRLRDKLGELAALLGAEAPTLPEMMAAELRATPALMPVCLGVDAEPPCSEQ